MHCSPYYRLESEGPQGLHGKDKLNGVVETCTVTSRESRRSWGLWFIGKDPLPRQTGSGSTWEATWLILPVVICLSQRLSHACLSINCFIL